MKRKVSNSLHRLWDAKGMLFAVIITAIMAFFDYAVLYSMFNGLHLSDFPLINTNSDVLKKITNVVSVYSFIAVLPLEVPPFIIGILLPLWDRGKSKRAVIGVTASFLTFLLSYALITCVRVLMIRYKAGPDVERGFDGVMRAVMAGTYGGSEKEAKFFFTDVFSLVSPFLTSLTAFVASWTAARNNSTTEAEKREEARRRDYDAAEAGFLSLCAKNEQMKTELWGRLSMSAPMPTKMKDFRLECFQRIYSIVVVNCEESLPGQLQRYNTEIEALLQGFVAEMENHMTTIPAERFKISDFVAEYDEKMKKAGGSIHNNVYFWAVEKVVDGIREKLMQRIYNGFPVVHYKKVLAQEARESASGMR